MKNIKEMIIAVMGIIIVILILDEYCYINVINSNCEVVVPVDTAAIILNYTHDDIRYGDTASFACAGQGGVTLSLNEANALIDNFQATVERITTLPHGEKGAYISKKAIDQIFKDITATGITFYYGLDINNDFRLLFEASKSTCFNISGDFNNKIFKSESMCPDECGNLIGR